MQVCPQHAVEHSNIEDCPECRKAVAMSVVHGSPKADTSRARTIAATYRLRELGCWQWAKNSQSAEDGNVATKWSAEAGKWATRADEMELRILEIEHDQWLVEQKRSLGN